MGETGSGGVSVVGLAVTVRVRIVSTVFVPVVSLIVAAEVNVVVTVFVEFALVLKVIWTGQSWNVDVVLSQYRSRLNRR